MAGKKVVNVTTEFVEGSGGLLDDAACLVTLGLVSGSKSDHHVATVTYDDGSVTSAEGSTKEEAIRNANKK